jgi:hypothetical protein
MKALFTIALLLLFTFQSHAQKEEAVAAAVGIGVAIFANAAAYDAFIEKLENEATEWVLKNKPECTEFQLKLMNLRGEKLSNMSEVSSCTFLVKPKGGSDFVMFWVVSQGWWNDFGVNFSRITVELFDRERWKGVLKTYFLCASGLPSLVGDSIPVYSFVQYEQNAQTDWSKTLAKQPWLENSPYPKITKVKYGQGYAVLQTVTVFEQLLSLSGRAFYFNNQITPLIPYRCFFEKMDGDSYVVRNFENLRIVYNERSVNIFFNDLNALVKIKNTTFESITKELLNLQ